MEISEALSLLLDVVAGVKAAVSSQEYQDIKAAIENHFHPQPAQEASAPADPAASYPYPAAG